MDSALNKVGLYDFFGVFLTGILVTAIFLCLDLPLAFPLEHTDNAVINLILFILESYFIGVILQEISSFIDRHILKIQKTSRSTFLNSNKIIKNELELASARHSANEILKINDAGHIFTNSENEYVYFHMKTFLETHDKMDAVERINSLFGMSRSLTAALSFCAILYFICNIPYSFAVTLLVVLFLILLIGLFYRRTKRFSRYKVRKIIRLYISMNP